MPKPRLEPCLDPWSARDGSANAKAPAVSVAVAAKAIFDFFFIVVPCLCLDKEQVREPILEKNQKSGSPKALAS